MLEHNLRRFAHAANQLAVEGDNQIAANATTKVRTHGRRSRGMPSTAHDG